MFQESCIMVRLSFRFVPALITLGILGAVVPNSVEAQSPRRNEIQVVPPVPTEEDLSQHNVWTLDVYMKPMRMIPVELTDPATGNKKLEYVRYITYRAIPKKVEPRVAANAPENQFDEPVSPPLFIPEFTLVITDNDRHEEHQDQVIPEALLAINKREKANYKSSVSIVGPIPEAAEEGAPSNALMGVAMWRGIDPEADRYTVFMTGFSNGYRKIEGPDGNPAVLTKTIVSKYIRRGDRFLQKEAEIEMDGDPKWIFR